jgi:hypothetical protein
VQDADEAARSGVGPARAVLRHVESTFEPLPYDGSGNGTQQVMNAALGSVLRAFGYLVTPFGSGGAWLVTGRRDDDPGAGRTSRTGTPTILMTAEVQYTDGTSSLLFSRFVTNVRTRILRLPLGS